ncbi:alpha/beta hydrolase-fold protein [Puniceicoccaceae bacterium K14]|nr:alpha/beta hydrolase-fold protein [Puniceicoccaceae bacterium K14]
MNEERHIFSSTALGNERNIWMRIPPRLESVTQLLVILDAEIYRDRVAAPTIIEELYEQEAIGQAVVVYVSYCNADARWKECPCHSPFATFVIEELYPWILARLPVLREARDRVLVGLSYTGLAASFVALKGNGLFNKVISQSGSYWSNGSWLTKEYEKFEGGLNVSFYLDVGDEETDVNVLHKEDVLQEVSQIEGVERFRDVLTEKGCAVQFAMFSGGHSSEGWASTLPSALKWALPIESPSNNSNSGLH